MPGNFDPSGMIQKLGEAAARVKEAALHAADEVGEQVLGDAQQICPISPPARKRKDGKGTVKINNAPGTLMSSATALPAQLIGDKISKVIGFNTVYAHYQHEGLNFRHTQGECKFLEKPMRHCRDTQMFQRHVAEAVKSALKG